MYQKRLQDVLGELETINYYIQNACIDPLLLDGVKIEISQQDFMELADKKLGEAFTAIDDFIDVMNGEKKV